MSSTPTSRHNRKPVQSRNPTQSNGPTDGGISGGTIRPATTKATTPSGRLIKKIHGQVATDTIQPPRAGASTGASSAGQVRYAVASRRSRFAVARSTTSRPTGTIIAPPIPCRIRAPTSIGRLTLRAQRAEATVNVAMAPSRIRRPPKRSVSQPLTGIPTAMVTR